ncbi:MULTISPECIES: homoserine dehydrogenase [Rhizobiaceae]|jgi:homoserine dehydrogenase|uniref:Homoserine dehydrogenase n=1 Tax=Aliirhizobium cellulosilyticum TaxID=393664 RepID=A0A7W4SVZ6_9HYPH|nr:homoserine dehydrogenase [Rhizobium cellulosilyticum]MBB4347856.1 homoserine dehydrogenase [Rhizobium cellulosilyticum]MBB4409750.1 homoserine dehydrogenase [Rhizobium cellulosilyticum]MBB4444437.1 homoserine dehydrogenase [Rhizobium cellulosilyticum]
MADALKVGIAGLGTVGASLVKIIQTRANELAVTCGRAIEITAITARDRNRDRGFDMSGMAWFETPEKLAAEADIDVFVELMGGATGAAADSVRIALERGLHVVTANKALLAASGVELATIAEEKGALLNFEAAVAGGIPVIKALRESLTGNTVSRVYGIMNGTCNYILTKMEKEGLSFEECLKEAQRLGYAEADPAFDIEGNDTAHKLAILTTLAFGTKIAADEIYLEGITNISIDDILAAADLGYRIKLLGVAQRTESGIEQRVHPTMVPHDSVIAQVDGVTNAVAIESDILGELLMVGPGAGGNATASAVLGDIADIAKSQPGAQRVPVLGTPAVALAPYQKARMRSHEGGYFIRLTVADRTGVFASVAARMAENNISLESIVQRPKPAQTDTSKTIILVTHATTEASIRKAVEGIKQETYLVGEPQVIRIERPRAS